MADRSQVSLIYSPACSPSRIITASSTTHFVLLVGLDATNVLGCLPSTIVDISRERAGHGLDAFVSFTCEGNWNLYSGRRSLLRDSMVLICSLGVNGAITDQFSCLRSEAVAHHH